MAEEKTFKNYPKRVVVDHVDELNANYSVLYYHVSEYPDIKMCGLVQKARLIPELEEAKTNSYIRFKIFSNGVFVTWIGVDK